MPGKPPSDLASNPDQGRESASDHGAHVHSYRLLSRADCREIDRLAIEQFGIPSLVLMENAARSICDVCADALIESPERPSVLVIAGTGNNGGDGLAAARHFANLGARVGIILAGPDDRYSGDPLTHLTIARRMGIPTKVFNPEKPRAALSSLPAPFSRPTLVVDAVLGTGYRFKLRPDIASLLGLCNSLGDEGASVFAIDVPSGLDADTGEPAPACVRADFTICLVSFKQGMLTETGRGYCGEIVLGDIGVPQDLIERFGEVVEFECDHDHRHEELEDEDRDDPGNDEGANGDTGDDSRVP